MTLFQGSRDFTNNLATHRGAGQVFCIGNFDGVHIGHRTLLAEAKRVATERGYAWGLLTFRPHPLQILQPSKYPGLLFSELDQEEQLDLLGCDYLVREPFDKDFANLSARDFAEQVLCQRLKAKHIIVGYNFHFGKGRQGDVKALAEFGLEFGWTTEILPQYCLEESGQVLQVSTSLIRELLSKAELPLVKKLLSRDFSIQGEVVAGVQRGRTIGVPTANIFSPHAKALKIGVYQTEVLIEGRKFISVTNVGYSPTFVEDSPPELKIETHILDFVGDLYGKNLKVSFQNYLREEKKFLGLAELKAQIAIDIAQARQRADKTLNA